MKKISNPISVVISTRKIDDEFVKKTKNSFSHPKTEILVYENNGEFSLPQLYNRGLNESTNEIIVFMHDDVYIETHNVTNKIKKLFEDNPEYGIIGLAGTDILTSGMWWEDRKRMYGQVKHTHMGKIWTSEYSGKFGDKLKDVVVVDGLFFAVHKGRIKENFDEDFKGFHFYDIPFCVRNHMNNVKIGVTTKIMVIHKSVGMTNQQWDENKKFFETKYGNNLPISI